MKKILLATTILGMSAGFAAAEVTWSASAGAGFGQSVGSDIADYSFITIGVTGSAETDSGLTFSATTDLTTGTKFRTGGDLRNAADVLADGSNFEGKNGSTFGKPTIAIGGSFGKISFSSDNFDTFDGADANDGTGDVKYEGTFGAFSVGVVTDISDAAFNASGDYSVQVKYSANNISLSADTESYATEAYNVSAGYTFGSITATLSTDESEVMKAKVAYEANGIKASLKVGDDDSWEATGGYAAGPLSIDASTDDAEYTKITGSYDLGGGLSAIAGADSDESAYLGAAMKF